MTVKEISEISNLSEGARELVREDSTPATYVDSLEKQELFQDAIRFQAHHLATDAGVKWACACARELQPPDRKDKKNESLEAADRWLQAPGDATRWTAKEAAEKGGMESPGDLAAMAVFLSGGSITPPEAPETQAPPYSAQKMLVGSILIAVLADQPEKAGGRYKRALALGKALG